MMKAVGTAGATIALEGRRLEIPEGALRASVLLTVTSVASCDACLSGIVAQLDICNPSVCEMACAPSSVRRVGFPAPPDVLTAWRCPP